MRVKARARRQAGHKGPNLVEKTAEEKLYESKLQVELLLQQLPAILWAVDADLRITMSQGKGLGGLNYRQHELVGRTLFEYLGSDDPNQQVILRHRHALAGNSTTHESQTNGRWLLAHLEPFRNVSGNTAGVIGVALDITDRKSFEEELVGQKQILELISFGRPLKEIFAALVKRLEAIAPGGRGAILGLEDSLPAEEGNWRQPIASTKGHPLGSLALCFDEPRPLGDIDRRRLEGIAHLAAIAIERERTEEALRTTVAELQRANRDLEQFASIVSHDLEEPLRMVSTYVGMVDDRYGARLDAEGREFLRFAVDGSHHMKALIRALRSLASVEGQAKSFVPVDVGIAVDRAIKNIELLISDTGASITRASLPVVHGHPAQLAQLFQNILSNALKFRGERAPCVRIESRQVAGQWEFTVCDNGLGIQEGSLKRIFDLFHRGHDRENCPGSGIGLAVCKKIVETHGGKIWATSVPGSGSTFHFTLPS